MMLPVADLHCDLLCYLQNDPKRTVYDPLTRCSIPQLRAGNVVLQVMPMFTETTPDSSKKGLAQAKIFRNLPKKHPDLFEIVDPSKPITSTRIGILLACENASSLCSEADDLQRGLRRIDLIEQECGKMLYISLTWNTENRFGGGALTNIGLKEDGEALVKFLHQKKIALDFSHASDYLAHDILNLIDRYSLEIPVIASHSNFRTICNAPRNLPDELAQEIIKRKGIIGLNFIRFFIGASDPSNLAKHIEHALKIGCENQLCFGADFFYMDDVSPQYRKTPEEAFFPQLQDASSYGYVLELLKQHLHLSSQTLRGIAFSNLHSFLADKIL